MRSQSANFADFEIGSRVTTAERKIAIMAKVTGPLLSISASGTVGQAMTFDKRGYVRAHVIPSNPQTENQMTSRNILGDIQRELRELGTVKRAAIKLAIGYRWNSLIIKDVMENQRAKWDASAGEYGAFQSGDKTTWETNDPGSGLVNPAGETFYIVATSVYDVCLRVSGNGVIALPTNSNAAAQKTAWIANS
jgi:hypothetical protein